MDTRRGAFRVSIPFTAYDVFGYLMPGVALCGGTVLTDWIRYRTGAVQFLPAYLSAKSFIDGLSNTNVLVGLVYLFSATVMIYLFGHLVSAVSSLVIDRVLMNKAYAYPYERFLSMDDHFSSMTPNRMYYRGLFFWVNVLLLLVYARRNLCVMLLSRLCTQGATFLIVAASTIAIFTIGTRLLGSTWYHGVQDGASRKWLRTWLQRVWAGPHDLPASVIASYLGTRASFGGPFVDKFQGEFKKAFGFDVSEAGKNAFWLPYAYITLKSDQHSSMLRTWLHLYGFARNLSTALYLCYLYSLVSLFHMARHGATQTGLHGTVVLVPLLFLSLAFIMWFRYFYLYSSYFSKFTFRSFYVLRKSLDS